MPSASHQVAPMGRRPAIPKGRRTFASRQQRKRASLDRVRGRLRALEQAERLLRRQAVPVTRPGQIVSRPRNGRPLPGGCGSWSTSPCRRVTRPPEPCGSATLPPLRSRAAPRPAAGRRPHLPRRPPRRLAPAALRRLCPHVVALHRRLTAHRPPRCRIIAVHPRLRRPNHPRPPGHRVRRRRQRPGRRRPPNRLLSSLG